MAIRHGETIENQNQIVQGQAPGTLAPEGIEQAKEVAKKLADEHFDVIFCSDLQRCKDTAKEIMLHHPDTPIKYRTALRELNQPEYEGQPWTAVPWDSFPGTLLTRKSSKGESFRDVWQRVAVFTNEVRQRYRHQSILFITHDSPIRGLIVLNGQKSPIAMLEDDFDMPNCSVWTWEVTKPLSLPNL